MFVQSCDGDYYILLTFPIFQCAKGVAYETPCYQGLAYSVEKHVW